MHSVDEQSIQLALRPGKAWRLIHLDEQSVRLAFRPCSAKSGIVIHIIDEQPVGLALRPGKARRFDDLLVIV